MRLGRKARSRVSFLETLCIGLVSRMFANKYLNLPTGAGLKKEHAKSLKPDNLLIGTENKF